MDLDDVTTIARDAYAWWSSAGTLFHMGTAMFGAYYFLNHTDAGQDFLWWLEKVLADALMEHLRPPGHWTTDSYFYSKVKSRRAGKDGAKPVRPDEGPEAPELIPAHY